MQRALSQHETVIGGRLEIVAADRMSKDGAVELQVETRPPPLPAYHIVL